METTTRIPTRGAPTSAERRLAVAQPQALPLPFDDGADEAVPFVLTAAAHREVLGRDAPPLVAVGGSDQPSSGQPSSGQPSSVGSGKVEAPGDGSSGEEVVDTRRVQARALLRSGMPVPTIAAALGTDAATVEGWTADLVDELARRRRRTRARPLRSAPGATLPGATPAAAAPPGEDLAALGPEGRARLAPGLALALASTDGEGVSIVHDRAQPIAVLLGAIRDRCAVDPARIRVAVRLAPELAADRTRTTLAEQLDVDADRITVGRAAPGASREMELRVDVIDATAARTVADWLAGAAGTTARTTAGTTGGTGLRGWDSNPQTFRLTADCSAS